MRKSNNAIKRTTGERIFDVINIAIMLLLIVLTLYPMWYVLMASFSDASALARHQGLLFQPQGFSLASYKAVWSNPMIGRGYLNTLTIVIGGTVLNLFMTSLCAYVLSRRNLPYKKILSLFVLFTMYFSGGLIPRYLVVSNLGLLNTYWAILLTGLISTYNMIIMRTYFQSIPESIEESATIDGANELVVLLRIILPLSKPVVAVMVLYYGVSHWNSWFAAMIYLQKREMFPLQLILREILISNSMESMTSTSSAMDQEFIAETIKYATIVVATVPILCIYPFLQKHFAKGIMLGAVKS